MYPSVISQGLLSNINLPAVLFAREKYVCKTTAVKFIGQGLLLAVLVTGLNLSAYAEPTESLEARIARLERVMNSQKQLELLFRVKQIKQENQQLRALIEEQSNEIRLLKQKQKDLYQDLNQRIGQIEVVKSNNSLGNKVEVIEKSTSVKQSKTEKNKPINQSETPAVNKKKSPSSFQSEQKDYQKAYNELIERQYGKARDSFIGFIKRYPQGRYAHIAQYWIAEASYAQHNYQQAIIDYQLLLDTYSDSPKKAEAELKKAFCYYELADKVKSREILNNLLKKYPNTTEAGQAKKLLRKL